MTHKIFTHYPLPPVQTNKNVKTTTTIPNKKNTDAFKNILQKEIDAKKLKFSNHCLKRLEQNKIAITENELSKIEAAVNKASLKGAKESLVILNNLALVVSVKNRTVITAVDGERMKDNVFTNIDSAVFA